MTAHLLAVAPQAAGLLQTGQIKSFLISIFILALVGAGIMTFAAIKAGRLSGAIVILAIAVIGVMIVGLANEGRIDTVTGGVWKMLIGK